MNLGQHVSDLIRLSQQIQKLSADVKDPVKLYHLSLEVKDIAFKIQDVAKEKLVLMEKWYHPEEPPTEDD